MHIYLIRHGQSLWQINESMSNDSELTGLGKNQSIFLNQYIREIMDANRVIPKIYVSPLKRAVQTVDSLNKAYTVCTDIKEASFHVASCLPSYEQPYFYKQGYSMDPTYNNFKELIRKAFEAIISLENHNNVYLYTHGGVIKTILRLIHDNDSICYTVNNCSVTKISWERSRWHIGFLNNISFLPGNLIS